MNIAFQEAKKFWSMVFTTGECWAVPKKQRTMVLGL